MGHIDPAVHADLSRRSWEGLYLNAKNTFDATEAIAAADALITLGIAHFINHPHFAFSYQIFYERFGRKAFGPDNDAALRSR